MSMSSHVFSLCLPLCLFVSSYKDTSNAGLRTHSTPPHLNLHLHYTLKDHISKQGPIYRYHVGTSTYIFGSHNSSHNRTAVISMPLKWLLVFHGMLSMNQGAQDGFLLLEGGASGSSSSLLSLDE